MIESDSGQSFSPKQIAMKGRERWVVKSPLPFSYAFTLLELLVACSIVALLAGLSVTAIHCALSESRRTACAGNLKQIGTAFWAYLGDNQMTLPQRFYKGDEGYDDRLAPYLAGGSNSLKKTFICPEHRNCDWPHQPSYGMNFYLDNLPVARLEKTSGVILVAETCGDSGGGSHRADLKDLSPGQRDLHRHGERSNYLMLDGHVESQGPNWANQTNLWSSPPE